LNGKPNKHHPCLDEDAASVKLTKDEFFTIALLSYGVILNIEGF
jgi:hypothetical protein